MTPPRKVRAKSRSVVCPKCGAPVGHSCLVEVLCYSKKRRVHYTTYPTCRARQAKAREAMLRELEAQSSWVAP